MSDYVPDPEISRLVRDLNEAARAGARRIEGPGAGDLEELLGWAVRSGASDLLLVAGSEPAIRVNGSLILLGRTLLEAEAIGATLRDLLDAPGLKGLAERRSLDLAFERQGVGRFRCNVHYQRGGPAIAIRVLPEEVPDLDELGLHDAVSAVAELRRGLVLFTGPTGSGKSTTMAALLQRISGQRPAHVLTIEEPIEYRLEHGKGLVEQVEVGRDSPSFAQALRAALRQDPDVIMVGEMRDPETIAITLTASETGHLVFTTLHTGDTGQAIERIIDVFPAGAKEFVRAQLATSLRAVIAQVLLPGTSGARVPACEVLLATDAVRNRIRKGETHQLHQDLTLGKGTGMVSLEESLASLVRAGSVDRREAAGWARHPDEFERLLGSSGPDHRRGGA